MSPLDTTPGRMRSIAGCMADARATPLASTFTAWRVNDRAKGLPIEMVAETLPDAITAALVSCQHKDTFVILERPPFGDAVMRSYAVKRKSRAKWITVDHVQRAVHDLYAEHLFDLAVAAFAPVELWRWTPVADVVGGDWDVVQGRAS